MVLSDLRILGTSELVFGFPARACKTCDGSSSGEKSHPVVGIMRAPQDPAESDDA